MSFRHNYSLPHRFLCLNHDKSPLRMYLGMPTFFESKKYVICVCFSGFWRPFRRVTDKGVLLWDRIHHLEKGQIYKQVIFHSPLFSCKLFLFSKDAGIWSVHFICCQGNLYEFLRLTGWRGSKVLYFGDHIYSDLAVRIIFCRFLHVHKPTAFCFDNKVHIVKDIKDND